MMDWAYTQSQPRTGKVIKDKRRIYVHYYFNAQHAADDKARLNVLLDTLEQELLAGKRNPEHEKLYNKYNRTTDSLSCCQMISKTPLRRWKFIERRTLIEKAFGNLKERLNMRRESVSSEENLEGKLFVQFIALIYLSYIKKAMDDASLFKNYTMQELVDGFDIIELFQQPGKDPHIGEITEKQKTLYEAMQVEVPS